MVKSKPAYQASAAGNAGENSSTQRTVSEKVGAITPRVLEIKQTHDLTKELAQQSYTRNNNGAIDSFQTQLDPRFAQGKGYKQQNK